MKSNYVRINSLNRINSSNNTMEIMKEKNNSNNIAEKIELLTKRIDKHEEILTNLK